MSNEEMTKLIVTLGSLGYRVVSVNPEFHKVDPFDNKIATSRTIIAIEPTNREKQGSSLQ